MTQPVRIGVLANPDSWYLNDLQRAAQSKAEIEAIEFSSLHSRIGANLNEASNLEHLDAVIVRTMPPGSLEQVIFRMDLLGQLQKRGKVIVNSPKALEWSIDKYLSLSKLAMGGIRVPQTVVCQTWQDAMQAYKAIGPSVVVKPLFGGEGRGVMRVDSPELAERTCKTLHQLGAVLYMQEFIDHPGFDLRVLMIGDEAWGMRRSANGDWRTNVSLGASATLQEIPKSVLQQAEIVRDILQLDLAGIDFLPDKAGNWYVIEANAVPGWKALSRVCGVDIAAKVVDYVIAKVLFARQV